MDEGALAAFDALKGLVRAVRNARAEYGVEEKRRVAATLVVADAGLRQALEAEIQVWVACEGVKGDSGGGCGAEASSGSRDTGVGVFGGAEEEGENRGAVGLAVFPVHH